MIVIESHCVYLEHLEANHALIKTISFLSQEKLTVIGEKKQINLLTKKTYSSDIAFISMSVNTKNLATRIITQALITFYGLLLAIRYRQDLLILSGSIFNIWPVKIAAAFTTRLKCNIILHGELSKINTPPKNWLRKILWIRNAIYLSNNDRINFVTLGKRIFSNLSSSNPEIIKHFKAIELPNEFNHLCVNKQPTDSIVLSGLGVASIDKGSHLIFKLADALCDINSVTFKHIGKFVDQRMHEFTNERVSLIGIKDQVAPELFEYEIESSDFITLFYPEGSYSYTFSGIVYDCIKFEKPILALDNEIFRELNSIAGVVAYTFKDLNQMIKFIKDKNPSALFDCISDAKSNYKKIKTIYTEEYFANHLSALI